jgi:hypothetical protein
MLAKLHFAEDAFALHLPLERFQCLIDIVISNENLHEAFLFNRGFEIPAGWTSSPTKDAFARDKMAAMRRRPASLLSADEHRTYRWQKISPLFRRLSHKPLVMSPIFRVKSSGHRQFDDERAVSPADVAELPLVRMNDAGRVYLALIGFQCVGTR